MRLLFERHRDWFLLFLVCFLAAHWQEVTSPTFNIDDWALINTEINQAAHGRPGWDLVYGLIFQHAYSPFLGWLIAAASIYISAGFLLGIALPGVASFWFFVLALLTAFHPFLIDLFNYSFAIGLYLVPAPISIAAVWLMGRAFAVMSLSRALAVWTASVIMFGFAMSIYQPMGIIGLVVFGVVLVARGLRLPGILPYQFGTGVGGVAAGGLGYYAFTKLWIVFNGFIPNERVGFASAGQFAHKLSGLGVYKMMYATELPYLPTGIQSVLTLSILLLFLASSIILACRRESVELVELWLGFVWILITPICLYYILASGYPLRAMGLANLGLCAVGIVILVSALAQEGPLGHCLSAANNKNLVRLFLALWLAGYVMPQAAYASKLWSETQLLERRDQALASAIYSDVRQIAYSHRLPADKFFTFGTTTATEPLSVRNKWDSVGSSAFRYPFSIRGIFSNLLGANVTPIVYSKVQNDEQIIRDSVPACAAYPHSGSILIWQDSVLVCLEPNP